MNSAICSYSRCKKFTYLFRNKLLKRQLSSDTPKKPDLYGTLGLNTSATQSEIKQAYYDLTFKYHPDRNEGSEEAELKFREVTEAYEVLGNYGLRKRYDKGLPLPLSKIAPADRKDIVEHNVKYQKFFDSRQRPQNTFYEESDFDAKWRDTRMSEAEKHPEENTYVRIICTLYLAAIILYVKVKFKT